MRRGGIDGGDIGVSRVVEKSCGGKMICLEESVALAFDTEWY